MQSKNEVNKRIGEVNVNRFGSKMTIVEYNGAKDILVKFEQGNYVRTFYNHFKNGEVKSPYDKSILGVGYLGDGGYKSYINGRATKQYNCWKNMIERCYNYKFQERRPSYKGCVVAEEWHNFQNFAKWYDENYYEVDEQQMNLDKDILIKGNKVYSPETCVFVPARINTLFVKSDSRRGDLPIGVSIHRDKYQVRYKDDSNKQVHLGLCETKLEAFELYKTHKNLLIKEVAEKYKSRIPIILYNAMLNYVIEIND